MNSIKICHQYLFQCMNIVPDFEQKPICIVLKCMKMLFLPDLPRDYCPYTLSSLRTAAEDPGQPVWTCHSAELAMAFYEYLTILCNGIFRSLKILFVLFLYLSMTTTLFKWEFAESCCYGRQGYVCENISRKAFIGYNSESIHTLWPLFQQQQKN